MAFGMTVIVAVCQFTENNDKHAKHLLSTFGECSIMEVVLDQWSVVDLGWNGYYRFPTVDEFRTFEIGKSLHGVSYGHDLIETGHRVRTSPVVKREGNVATTESGTRYILTNQYKPYTEWLDKQFVQAGAL